MIQIKIDDNNKVLTINYGNNLIEGWIEIPEIPEPEQRDGYDSVMYYRNGKVEYEYLISDELPHNDNTLYQAKENKLYEITQYDLSEEVNSFTYKGVKMWFNKADRVGLRNSLEIEKRIGRTESTMWFGNIPIVVNIDEGLRLLDAIELYALDCYNVTARHKAEIDKLTTVDEVSTYDITKDYPKQLSL